MIPIYPFQIGMWTQACHAKEQKTKSFDYILKYRYMHQNVILVSIYLLTRRFHFTRDTFPCIIYCFVSLCTYWQNCFTLGIRKGLLYRLCIFLKETYICFKRMYPWLHHYQKSWFLAFWIIPLNAAYQSSSFNDRARCLSCVSMTTLLEQHCKTALDEHIFTYVEQELLNTLMHLNTTQFTSI